VTLVKFSCKNPHKTVDIVFLKHRRGAFKIAYILRSINYVAMKPALILKPSMVTDYHPTENRVIMYMKVGVVEYHFMGDRIFANESLL
jgi:hypothetical protein